MATVLVAVLFAHAVRPAVAQTGSAPARGPVQVTADFSRSWQSGDETVYLLHGRCLVEQGVASMSAGRAVLWRRTDHLAVPPREVVTVYLEDGVRVEQPGVTRGEQAYLARLETSAGLKIAARRPLVGQPAEDDPTYQRALEHRRARRRPAALVSASAQLPAEPELESRTLMRPPGSLRRFRIYSRTGGRWSFESFPAPDVTPPEQVLIFTGGINLLIEGLDAGQGNLALGTIDLSADRIVIWTDPVSTANFSHEAVQSQELPLQVYLEGNIVIRQGENVMRASQAFYDAREERALLLNAELKAKIPGVPARVRVRAQRLRQLARDTYQAERAFLTTSEFGKPGYRLEAENLYVEPRDAGWFGRRAPRINAQTGELEPARTLWATALNNTFFVEDVPVFYYPYLSVPAEDPNIPLRNVNFQSDRVFGFQARTTWDIFKLFSLDAPDGYRWDLLVNYLSKRGPEFGTQGGYRGQDRFGLEGSYRGSGWATLIFDEGLDNLGLDRKDLIPDHTERGGFLLRDRWDLPYNLALFTEASYISDRNYLEAYRELDYDVGKDYETQLLLKQQWTNWAWSVWARPRTFDYFTTTQWLPRGDLFVLGEPLPGGWLTWSMHSMVGYASMRTAEPPSDPHDLFSLLPFEGNANGLLAMTRHELALPLALGPVHLVPYVMGEAAWWQETFSGDSLDRLYGAAGLRGSLEFWRVFPEVHSDLFNLHGLAHKMVFDADYSYAQSNAALALVPQFSEFDDNSQEQFRRRLLTNTFGGTLPAPFDPRSFALRSGAAQSVTAPYYELVDDLHVVRLGWRNRLQTKAGPPGNPRIKNWMTLDLEASFFPEAARDNFDEVGGLYGVRYNWYVGDRTTLTAGALFDAFDDAEHLWNVGLMSQRSQRGSVYVGYRQIEGGPLRSQILSASYSYVMSPKWISTLSTAYDFGEGQNRGQSLTITRVGADFLIHLGATIDTTKDNFGVGLSIEPRFAPLVGNLGPAGSGTQLGSLLQPYGH